jgi:hypothetical protein
MMEDYATAKNMNKLARDRTRALNSWQKKEWEDVKHRGDKNLVVWMIKFRGCAFTCFLRYDRPGEKIRVVAEYMSNSSPLKNYETLPKRYESGPEAKAAAFEYYWNVLRPQLSTS